MEKIKAAVVGSTGYAGEELVRILSNHKNVELKFLTSRSYKGQNFQDVYSNFNKGKIFKMFILTLTKF